jgi:hypothetical protein
MNLSALIALYLIFLGFSKGHQLEEKNIEFTQSELAKITELLHGQGCTLYMKKENLYFISLSKEEKTGNNKKNPFRIAQIRASHQGLIFLKNEFKRMVEISESGEIKQYILNQYLPEITPLHSMIIDNEAKNHVIQYKEKTETYYIFYSKI